MDGQFRILVADGSRYVRDYFRRELEEHGYEVMQAADYREAFLHLDREDAPDLVILDLNLPHTGGMNVLMRLQHRAPPMPVIVCSVFTEFEHHPVVETADAFVEKEGNPASVLKAVREILRKHYPERISRELNGEKLISPARSMK